MLKRRDVEKKGIAWETLQSQKISLLIWQGGEGREFWGCKQTQMSWRGSINPKQN